MKGWFDKLETGEKVAMGMSFGWYVTIIGFVVFLFVKYIIL